MFGLAPVRGTFAVRAGSIDLDGPGAGPAIYAEIDAASFRTGNWLRDRSVLSPAFPGSRQLPGDDLLRRPGG